MCEILSLRSASNIQTNNEPHISTSHSTTPELSRRIWPIRNSHFELLNSGIEQIPTAQSRSTRGEITITVRPWTDMAEKGHGSTLRYEGNLTVLIYLVLFQLHGNFWEILNESLRPGSQIVKYVQPFKFEDADIN